MTNRIHSDAKLPTPLLASYPTLCMKLKQLGKHFLYIPLSNSQNTHNFPLQSKIVILEVIDKQLSFLKEFQEDQSFRVMYKSQERKWGKNVSGVGGGKPVSY